jgi:phage tail protein X
MTAAASPAPNAQTFSARTILALVIVGVVSFSGLAVLATFAPELRGGADAGAHALSSSAVGFKGAQVMLRAEGAPVVVSRMAPRPGHANAGITVVTPNPGVPQKDLNPFFSQNLLIVLPKWRVTPQPARIGWVLKAGPEPQALGPLLAGLSKVTHVTMGDGVSRPKLYGAGGPFQAGTYLPLDPIDQLQTLSGDDWTPALVDEHGRMVLAQSKTHRNVLVLADPDILNNQGLAKLDNARAGMAILNTLRGDGGVTFDVTLNGFSRGHGVGQLMLEPPFLAATLCGVAAALLLGLHALARFGPTLTRGRAIALGKSALVDNSAGLVRMARREAELAPAYAALTKSLVARIVGGPRSGIGGARDNETWLAELARRAGAADPADLTAQAERAQTRDELLAVGRSLYHWRAEITREGR